MRSIRPNVLKMHPYVPGKPIDEVKRELGLDQVVKLASNENPVGPSPLAIAAVKAAAETMHIYPDGSAFEVNTAVSATFGVPIENILLGNGSDEIIHLLGLAFMDGPKDEMIVGYPSFVRYDAAAFLADSALVKVNLDENLRHDVKAMAAKVTENTKLLFIANPNNPTGTITPKADIDWLLSQLPETCALVLDEAYFEFAAGQPGFPNSAEYVLDGKNLIGLRTFSKAYGLAGIRIGYGFAPAYVVDALERAREPFNVNSLAQAAGIAALKDTEHLKATVRLNAEGLAQTKAIFKKHGFKVYESFANFILADLGRPAQPIFQALLQQGVITRSGHLLGLPSCLRVSIGTKAEMEAFDRALSSVLAAI